MESMTLALALLDEKEFTRPFFVMGATVSAAVVGVLLIVSLLGIQYLTLAVAPNLTQRCSGALRERNIRSFFVGLPVLLGFLGVGGLTLEAAPALAAVNGMAFLVALMLGFTAASEDIGRRLYWACGKEGSRASHLASGWLVFAFATLFPIIGAFVILPWVSVSGLGSIVVGAFSGRRAPNKDIEFQKE